MNTDIPKDLLDLIDKIIVHENDKNNNKHEELERLYIYDLDYYENESEKKEEEDWKIEINL